MKTSLDAKVAKDAEVAKEHLAGWGSVLLRVISALERRKAFNAEDTEEREDAEEQQDHL